MAEVGWTKPDDIGRYTCCTHNGRSTVDYVLCSSVYLESIINFNMRDHNQFLDHNALKSCLLVYPSSISDKIPEITHEMIWNHQSVNEVDEFVDMLTNALRKAADPYFLQKFNNKKRQLNKGYPAWADEEWLPSENETIFQI